MLKVVGFIPAGKEPSGRAYRDAKHLIDIWRLT